MDVDEPISITDQGSPRTRKRRGSTTTATAGSVISIEAPAPKRSRRSNKDNNSTPIISNGNHVQSSDQMDIDPPAKRDVPTAPPASTASDLPAGNGLSNTITTVANGTDAVDKPTPEAPADADAEGDADADFAALDESDALITPPHTVTEVGVQSDKIIGSEITVLRLSDRHKSDVTHAVWNTQDPAVLATGGESIFRIWTIPPAAVAPTDENGSRDTNMVNGESHDLVNREAPIHDPREAGAFEKQHDPQQQMQWIDLLDMNDGDSVTAMCWSPNGEHLAVAINRGPCSTLSPPDIQGCVFILTKSGSFVHSLTGPHNWILSLDYNPEGNLLMGITNTDNNSATLLAWQTQSGAAFTPYEISHVALGMHWTSVHGEFVLCTNKIVGHGRVDIPSNTVIVDFRLNTAAEGYDWAKFTFDPVTKLSAVATEATGALGIVRHDGHLDVTRAHDSEITALAFQPLSNEAAYTAERPRLLATSCADGSINVWDATRPFQIMYILSLGASTSALAISFTPDGFLFGAGSRNKIMVWNAEEGGSLKAVWSKITDNAWHTLRQHSDGDVVMSNGINGEADSPSRADTPIHSMSWDADGRKLAYTAKDMVCFRIEVPRKYG